MDDAYNLLKQAVFQLCVVDVMPFLELKEAVSNVADVEDFLFYSYFQRFKVD